VVALVAALMEPFIVTKNPMGITAVRLNYRADPEKNPENPDPAIAEHAIEWLRAQSIAYPDANDFQREFECNWNAGHGARVFPQFSEAYHVRGLALNRRRVVFRGWDFGWHSPCCLFAQIDAKGRLCLIRELVGARQTTADFAQAVIRRSGEWFPQHAAGFEDFCDPAGQQVKSIESERSERRDTEILAGLGIPVRYEHGWSRKDGRTLVHQTLALRTDGTPTLYVDGTACPTLTQAFLGRYVYPETKDGGIKNEPDDDTHPWADVMAALRYLLTGVSQKLDLVRWNRRPVMDLPGAEPTYHGYGSPRR